MPIHLAGFSVVAEIASVRLRPRLSILDRINGMENIRCSRNAPSSQASVPIISGRKPCSMAALATETSQCPCAWPMSNKTPRFLASHASGRTLPSGPSRIESLRLLYMCVRMSSLRKRSHSRPNGIAVSEEWMTRRAWQRSASSSARSSGFSPMSLMTPVLTRSLMPISSPR